MKTSSQGAHVLMQGHCSAPHSTPDFSPNQPNDLAAACVQSEAILDVAENLTTGQKSMDASVARISTTKVVRKYHNRYWKTRMAQDEAIIRLRGSFGAEDVVAPFGLETGADGYIWVTSLCGERISVFSPEGDLVRHVPLHGSQPWGIFQAGQESLWVCDLASPQLLRVGMDGKLEQPLTINTGRLEIRPLLGAIDGPNMYLIIGDNTGRNRRLARLRTDADPTLEMLHCPTPNPSGIRVHDGRLYLSSQNPPALLSRPLKGDEEDDVEKAWEGFNRALLPDLQDHFVFSGKHVWLAARGRLTRLNETGTMDMVMDAGTLVGYPDSNFSSLTTLDGPDGTLLFVAEKIHNLIHCFQLG
jgi:hypothetical protein